MQKLKKAKNMKVKSGTGCIQRDTVCLHICISINVIDFFIFNTPVLFPNS